MKKKKWIYVALCYGLALLLYVGVCGIQLWRAKAAIGSGELVEQQLVLEDFELLSILHKEDVGNKQVFVSTDGDPQLIYRLTQPQRVTRLVFDASSHVPGGEMVLYYSTAPDGSFLEKDKLWARRDMAGRWYFDLDGKEVTALRLDPDTVEQGVVWQVNEIVLNAHKPSSAYFVPDAWQVAVLLLVPVFAGAAFYEAIVLVKKWVSTPKGDINISEERQTER